MWGRDSQHFYYLPVAMQNFTEMERKFKHPASCGFRHILRSSVKMTLLFPLLVISFSWVVRWFWASQMVFRRALPGGGQCEGPRMGYFSFPDHAGCPAVSQGPHLVMLRGTYTVPNITRGIMRWCRLNGSGEGWLAACRAGPLTLYHLFIPERCVSSWNHHWTCVRKELREIFIGW